MDTISGKDAFIKVGAGSLTKGIQSWVINRTVTSQRFSYAGIAGKSTSAAGIIDYAGTVSGVGAYPVGAFPGLAPVSATFITESGVTSWAASALFDTLTISYDMASVGAPVQWTASFGVVGDFTKGTAVGVDAGDIVSEFGKDLDILLNDSSIINGGTVGSVCVQNASLTFRRPATQFVCGGSVMQREPGNLEADVSISVIDTNPNTLFTANTTDTVQFELPSNYWELSDVRWLNMTGYTVNNATPPVMVGYTINGQWTGDAISGAVTI